MQNDFRQCQQTNDSHNCECLMAIEEAQGCPEVKQMLLEAAVMDLEDALAGIGRAESEARACIQRIKNLLNGLQMCGADKELK